MKNVARAPVRAEPALPGAVGGRVARVHRANRCLCAGAALLLGCSLGWTSDGAAQDASAAGQQPSSTSANSLPDALRKLTDPDGVRSKLEQAGIKFTFTYYGDAFANPIGGVTQGAGYDGRFGTIIDADLDKLAGWAGATFHASIHQIHGTQFSATNLDNLMTVSGIEAPPSTRLFNLWIEQKVGTDTSVRAGQFSAAQEFIVSQYANLFVNSTFGWPVLAAQDLPSGGPAYPEATPGLRVSYAPNDRLTIRAAIFNGDPAGPGPGNPVERDPFGLALRVNDPPFLIGEVAYAYNQSGGAQRGENPHQEGTGPASPSAQGTGADLPGTIKLGAWLHTGTFADERFNGEGGLLAAGGVPLAHRGNFAVYGVIDQMLWHSPACADCGLSAFMRATAAPTDRNLVDFYLDAGVTFKGPLPGRPDDTVGVAFAYARISPQAAAHESDVAAISGSPMPIQDFEAAIELTYQVKLAGNWSVQPDVQYIVHPGGNISDPGAANPASRIPNALVLGLRTMLKF
jgi:porin